MTKIVFIGAGSFVFTRNLIRDVLTFPRLQDATLALVDLDPERLEFARRAAQRLFEVNREYLPGWPVGELALRGQ